ncbi:MAG: cation:proton antiporter [Clostridia bacterium]|nr:cation:proton antiporter [Clostridia bacterium]MDE7329287.1 cation:proton antiporter [Clostridia bacterium]
MNTILEIINNDYWVFFEIAIVLVATKLFGVLLKKLGLPQVLGALLAGVVLGIINLILSKINPSLFIVDSQDSIIAVLAAIGVNLIMFSAGMETNLSEIKKNGVASLVITALGVVVPLVVGFAISWILPDRLFNQDIDIIKQRFFFGVILTATSVGITVAVLKELNVLHGKVGASIVTAAILDDIIGIVILAVFTANTESFSIGKAFLQLFTDSHIAILITLLNVFLFFAVAIGLGALIHFIFKKMGEHFPHTRRLSIFSLAVCFFYAAMAEVLFGVAAITGSFMAGMMIANMKESHYVERRIDMSAYMLFSPMFFANIGISLDYNQIGKMFSGSNVVYIILFCLAFVIFGMAAKFVGCGLGAKMCKYNWQESSKVGIGMMVRGEVCLIVANTGKAQGLISEEYYPAIILLIIVSSILTPLLLKTLYKKFPHTEIPSLAKDMEGLDVRYKIAHGLEVPNVDESVTQTQSTNQTQPIANSEVASQAVVESQPASSSVIESQPAAAAEQAPIEQQKADKSTSAKTASKATASKATSTKSAATKSTTSKKSNGAANKNKK